MLRQLVLLALTLAVCQAQFVQLRIQEPEELPAFQRVFISDGSQQMLSSMHSPINALPAIGQPLFGGMQRTTSGDWDSWMDTQFNTMQAMNQAVLGRRGGCGGHRQRQSFGPVLIRGMPTLTTPAAVMQRLASARFGNDLLRALIQDQAQDMEQPEAVQDLLAFEPPMGDEESSMDGEAFREDTMVAKDPEEDFEWAEGERLLSQADDEEEADAEADATEVPQAQWTSLMPTWFTAPEDQELLDEPSPATINWNLTNDDGSTNWGLVVFIVQATACASVWVGLVATLGYYRFVRRGRCLRRRMASPADSHLMTPLMYEPPSKADNTAQLYEDLYHVEDAKLHADDRQYVAIQYAPVKSDM